MGHKVAPVVGLARGVQAFLDGALKVGEGADGGRRIGGSGGGEQEGVGDGLERGSASAEIVSEAPVGGRCATDGARGGPVGVEHGTHRARGIGVGDGLGITEAGMSVKPPSAPPERRERRAISSSLPRSCWARA